MKLPRVAPGAIVRMAWILFFSALSACVRVPAYDRGALAEPSMTTSDLTRPGEAHARDVQEGATGGGLAAGGGCGCN